MLPWRRRRRRRLPVMRPAGLGLSLHATAAAAVSPDALVPLRPTTGVLLGYEFDWGPMIAGLLACLAVRFYVSKTEPEHRWTVDIPVTALAMLFTAGVILSHRPEPIMALFYGTGLGAFGVGIIRVALSFVSRNLGGLGGAVEPRAPADPAHASTARQWAGELQPTPPDMAQQLDRIPDPEPKP